MNITKHELIQTFSKDRVESYVDEFEYINNLRLIKKITPLIQCLEVYIRNRINEKMTLIEGENWLFSYNSNNSLLTDMNSIMVEIDKIMGNQTTDTLTLEQELIQYKIKNKPSKDSEKIFRLLDDIVRRCKKELIKSKPKLEKIKTRKQALLSNIISKQSFGFWANVVQNNQLKILKYPHYIDFFKYGKSIRESRQTEIIIREYNNKEIRDKTTLNLLVNLRNRAYHCENLFGGIEGKICRVTTAHKIEKEKGLDKVIFGLKGEKIEDFIYDCIKAYDVEVIGKIDIELS